jgi:glycine/D-amino acid oxidase-like deaminating enzyme
MAGGGYARRVYPLVERAVLPIATYVMATEPLGSRLQDAIDTRAAVYDTRFAFDYYRPLPDTRILWGGRISVRDRAPEVIARLLRRDLLKVYPQLHDVGIEYAWGGLMSYARHKMPQIGRSADGVLRRARPRGRTTDLHRHADTRRARRTPAACRLTSTNTLPLMPETRSRGQFRHARMRRHCRSNTQ